MVTTLKFQPSAILRKAFIFSLSAFFAALLLFMPFTAQAQARPAVPDENTLARLVWSTMVTVDNANRTGNYSVIYDLGSPNFQAGNSPEQLAQIFGDIRANRVDVGRAILTAPTWYLGPNVDQYGRLRLRGAFEYRPKSIRFDLLYELFDGGWQINAISVVEMDYNAPR